MTLFSYVDRVSLDCQAERECRELLETMELRDQREHPVWGCRVLKVTRDWMDCLDLQDHRAYQVRRESLGHLL